MALCRWPRPLWVQGDPPPGGECWAVVSLCSPGVTVTLWPTLEQAERAKQSIDDTGCGGSCWRRHRILALHAPEEDAP
jgi:hypothetical protein